MASQPEYPSAAPNTNTYSAQCQELTLEDVDKQLAGVSNIGKYDSAAEDIEALWHSENSDTRRRELFSKAREWFDPDTDTSSGKLESRMYPQLKALIYLIALYVRDKRAQCNLPLQRYLLLHPLSNVQGDPTTRKRHDIVLRWHDPDPLSDSDPDMGVGEECDVFLEWCKAQYNKSQEVKDFGQLGWYVCSALEAVFEPNNMWGWVVSGTTVRFVFFTHGAAVSSPIIDMKDKKGRQIFIDKFIRLCLCSPCRAGFDPTKRWLEDVNKWEVDCFGNTNPEKAEIVRAYVDHIPFKIHGGLFGRRTRCHYASLTKFVEDKETTDFVLKESWTELDLNSNQPRNMNTESLSNEVRVFQEIERRRGGCRSKCIEYGLPKLKVGGSVRIDGDSKSGSGYFSTVRKYCSGLNIVNRAYNVQPSSPTTTESGSDDTDPPFEVVNRVHQRHLISPIGEPLTELHSWVRKPENKTQILDKHEKNVLAVNVQDVFVRLYPDYLLPLHGTWGLPPGFVRGERVGPSAGWFSSSALDRL
ncbi:hypothetical protein IWQ61_000741 [Dispira simplex]|nr:hypothetical protein IWQ61_000741 [Dispira simplex]